MSTFHDVRNPATGEVIGQREEMTPEQIEAVVQRSRDAQPAWARLPESDRIQYLKKAVDHIMAEESRLIGIVTREVGRPVKAPGWNEVLACMSFAKALCSIPLEEKVVLDTPDCRAVEQYTPHGVIGVIAPWNWPLLVATFAIAPALRMGNTVVLKPSEYTTLCSTAFVEALSEVLPEGVVTVATGGPKAGAHLISLVDKVCFTGSAQTGRIVASGAAKLLKPASMEMGGNDPSIILPGTNLDNVLDDIFLWTFLNCGQTCTAIKRVYAHESQYEQVVDGLAERARNAVMGDGSKPEVQFGPLQNEKQLGIVEGMVDEARERGARIVTGGKKREGPGLFYELTVVADVDDDALLVREEQFGPAIPVMKYTDVNDAVRRANSGTSGLGASVWGDAEKSDKIARQMEAGSVWINSHCGINPLTRFGGWKESSYGGAALGVDGLRGMAKIKIVYTKK